MTSGLKRDPTGDFAHVCMPVLHLSALLFLRASSGKTRPCIHYEILPLYLKGMAKCLGVSRERLANIIGRLAGLPVEKIKHGDKVEGYEYLRLGAMSDVVDICFELASRVKKDRWAILLSALIGEKPAVAYSLKNLAHYQVYLHVLPLAVCNKSIDSKEEILFVCDPGWPTEWIGIVRQKMRKVRFVSFSWPRWYLRLYRLFFYSSIYLGLPVITLVQALKRGIVFGQRAKKHYKVMTEFIDPLRLNRTPFDADYLVDGNTIKESDLLLFLTRAQMKMLGKFGCGLKEVMELVKGKNYELAVLYKLPFKTAMLWSLARLWFRAIRDYKGYDSLLLGSVFFRAWLEYLEYQPVFDHYEVENVFYITMPHGRAGDRRNSALIAGLGRKRGVRVFGCQTRTVDSRHYAFYFDEVDGYFSWGRGWQESLPGVTTYLGRVIEVGCLHLDALIPRYRQYQDSYPDSAVAPNRPRLVSIFPTDIDLTTAVYSGSFFPLGYVMSFLESCANLARAHQDLRFVVKPKDPEHVELILQQARFRDLFEQVRHNFTFETRLRTDYLDLLSASDIVLAIAFTSPGIEGLFLGKRLIYYSQLVGHGNCFKTVPDLVAENVPDFERLFAQALGDFKEYAKLHEKTIGTLEPFRDGLARERILWNLKL
jgi:hypothetical protein